MALYFLVQLFRISDGHPYPFYPSGTVTLPPLPPTDPYISSTRFSLEILNKNKHMKNQNYKNLFNWWREIKEQLKTELESYQQVQHKETHGLLNSPRLAKYYHKIGFSLAYILTHSNLSITLKENISLLFTFLWNKKQDNIKRRVFKD